MSTGRDKRSQRREEIKAPGDSKGTGRDGREQCRRVAERCQEMAPSW